MKLMNITDYEIDKRSSVDMNPLRGLEDSRLCEKFDQWFAGKFSVDQPVQQSRNFFEILMGNALMGWLGDEVSVFNGQYITILFIFLLAWIMF